MSKNSDYAFKVEQENQRLENMLAEASLTNKKLQKQIDMVKADSNELSSLISSIMENPNTPKELTKDILKKLDAIAKKKLKQL